MNSENAVFEALHSMLVLFKENQVWLLVPVIFVFVLKKLESQVIVDAFLFLSGNRKRRLDSLLSVCAIGNMPPRISGVYDDIVEQAFFFYLTGINSENVLLRAALANLHNASKGVIKWCQMRRAIPHMDVCDEGNIFVNELTFFDKAVSYFYSFAAIFFIFWGCAFGITAVVILASHAKSFLVVVFSVSLMAMGYYIGTLAQPIYDAMAIKKYLDVQVSHNNTP